MEFYHQLYSFYVACVIYVGSAISYRMIRTMNYHFKAKKKGWEKKLEIQYKMIRNIPF